MRTPGRRDIKGTLHNKQPEAVANPKIESILRELYSRDGSKFKLGLTGIRRLLRDIGNPEKRLKCVHVAGSNGKGSVCSMLASVLAGAGLRTGLYTSPHLKAFNERISVNGVNISDDELAAVYESIGPYVTGQTFFEITTALAFR